MDLDIEPTLDIEPLDTNSMLPGGGTDALPAVQGKRLTATYGIMYLDQQGQRHVELLKDGGLRSAKDFAKKLDPEVYTVEVIYRITHSFVPTRKTVLSF